MKKTPAEQMAERRLAVGKRGWPKGRSLTEEHRAALRDSRKGRPLTEEHRAKLRAAWTEERRNLVSAATQERRAEPQVKTVGKPGRLKGCVNSTEHRAKISAGLLKSWVRRRPLKDRPLGDVPRWHPIAAWYYDDDDGVQRAFKPGTGTIGLWTFFSSE